MAITDPRKPMKDQVDRDRASHEKWTSGDPQFQVHSIPDNGLWDSVDGVLDTPFFDPTQLGA